ncbi:lipopolysaccharide transport periplasmic protein LptA [Gilvimarinus sp. DA14]|uniref:lipopolysaccharide transport periplasmic protein LptA n=1 Tax=Gilvimarinus sp. DA14 TaxID=2956798 RepID=UPI0020B8FA90|nr:lipopolysaccharide transport periplasmic protein LptA [Gilvimarinus sp. DA14]UTF59684.1 lipopolysaccharide transport periplasmic protein LptA [Gilvimarinus sp. DA14]
MIPFKSQFSVITAAFLATLLFTLKAQALPDDREQPFQLQADTQTFDQKNGRITYSGNALLQQGSLLIKADTITVEFTPDNSVKVVTAKGKPAHFQQKPSAERGIVSAEANEIVYDSANNTVSMTEAAKLEQDGAIMRGHSIHYDLTQELVNAQSDAEGQDRIQMTIPPAAIEQ